MQLETRPSRIEDNKDEKYHVRYARWAAASTSTTQHNKFVENCFINWSFYKGNQWVFQEDLDAFLLDDTGETRNRLRFTKNIIKPMIRQFIGNAIETDFNCEAVPISSNAVSRRETALSKMLLYTEVARNMPPEISQFMKAKTPIGDTADETRDIFESVYVDRYAQKINKMIKSIAEANRIGKQTNILARNLALCGLTIAKNYPKFGELCTDVIDPRFFIFDRGARRPDLKDAAYMGEYHLLDPNQIFERFLVTDQSLMKAIENYSIGEGTGTMQLHTLVQKGMSIGKVPVYEIYWRDSDASEYGYIKDEYGYPYFTKIGKGTKYTDADLIKNPRAPKDIKKKLGRSLKVKIYESTIRYAIFIPREEIKNPNDSNLDIILEYGIAPYTEQSCLSAFEVEYPYKCYTWDYDNGEILTPIDDIISPQRFINRMLSVTESQINSAGGRGAIIDSDAISNQDGEIEVERKIKRGETVFVRANGQLNNVLGTYDASVSNAANIMLNIVDRIGSMSQEVTGVTDMMQGTAGGYRQLVGVQQLQIQRGVIMQEPFYFAISEVIEGVYNGYANQGKKVYADSKRKLSSMIGDKWYEEFVITEEESLDLYRAFVKRTPPEIDQISAVNSTLLTLLSAQLIDETRFSQLFNRGTMLDLSVAMQEFVAEKKEAQRLAEKAQQQQEAIATTQMSGIASQQQAGDAQNKAIELAENEKDRQNKLDAVALKETLKQ